MEPEPAKKEPIRKVEVYMPRSAYKKLEALAAEAKMTLQSLVQHLFIQGCNSQITEKPTATESTNAKPQS